MGSLYRGNYHTMKTSRGFTLIELMIVVAIVAVLAAIAVPAYNEQVRKGRRADAVQGVSQLRLDLEKWRADRPSYANTAPASPNYPALPISPFYTFAIANPTATGYSITATPQGAQAGDKCGVLTQASAATKPTWATASCN